MLVAGDGVVTLHQAARLLHRPTVPLPTVPGRRLGSLARRFGAALLLRLDQALARRPEPLSPLTEAADYAATRGFLDPIGRQSDIVRTARDLMAELAPRLERDGLGACALRLALHRIDGAVRDLDLGLSRPERDPERVAALVSLRIDRLGAALDAGFGFETVTLTVTVTGAMPARQTDLGAAVGAHDALRPGGVAGDHRAAGHRRAQPYRAGPGRPGPAPQVADRRGGQLRPARRAVDGGCGQRVRRLPGSPSVRPIS